MKVLGEEVDFKGNLMFSLEHYPLWWVILLITITFDYLTTVLFVEQSGVGAEANLVIAWLMANIGVMIGLLIGKLLQLFSAIAFVSLNRRLGNIMLLVIILLNCWAVAINTF